MDEKLILSFDCGTQSVRAMIFNDKGELLCKIKECFEPYFSEEEGFAEQDANLYYEKICDATQKLKKSYAGYFKKIIGVSITTMRDVGVCVDKDMKPLRPAIIWLDRRKAKCEDKLPLKSRLLFFISGTGEIVRKKRVDCKSNWIRENQPELWEKTEKYVQLSAFLNYRLTGNLCDSVASTIGLIPINYKKRTWYPDSHFMMPGFKVENKKLYPLVEPCSVLGYIGEAVSLDTGLPVGLPVVASGSDKGCETIGTGSIYKNTASISFGTTATIQITTEKYVEPLAFLPAYPSVYPNRFNPEIIIYRGYWMLTWFVRQFLRKEGNECCASEKELDKRLNEVPPGCEGLYIEPYWAPGLKSPEARGAMIGFRENHTLIHIYRALIEGINYALMEGAKNLEKRAKTKIEIIAVSGGGAASDQVCQITADMFGLPVVRAQTHETSGLGAAICAFVGLNHFDSYETAIQNMVHTTRQFMPDPKKTRFYHSFYKSVYKDTYRRLKPIFITMKDKQF